MNSASKLAMVAVLALAVAGCAPKKPKQLPPAPGEPAASGQNPGGADQNAGGVTPGSVEDFRAQAGSDTIHFGTDLYDIDSSAAAVLDAQAAWLAKYPSVRVTIEGHCDERGTREYNLALGARRANSVREFLVSHGVAPGRITTISYGKERPLDPGNGEDAWAKNRNGHTAITAGAR